MFIVSFNEIKLLSIFMFLCTVHLHWLVLLYYDLTGHLIIWIAFIIECRDNLFIDVFWLIFFIEIGTLLHSRTHITKLNFSVLHWFATAHTEEDGRAAEDQEAGATGRNSNYCSCAKFNWFVQIFEFFALRVVQINQISCTGHPSKTCIRWIIWTIHLTT